MKISIDSMSLSIELKYVKILDSTLAAKAKAKTLLLVDAETAEILDEIENPRVNADLKVPVSEDKNGNATYSIHYKIVKSLFGKGDSREVLMINVNSKFLEGNYLEGIRKETLVQIHQKITSQGIVSIPLKHFVKGMCHDVDLKIDSEEDVNIKVLSTEMMKSVKLKYKIVSSLFNRGETGLSISDRNSKKYPLYKMYAKRIELDVKSGLFKRAYLSDISENDIPQLRHEITFKNVKIMRDSGLLMPHENRTLETLCESIERGTAFKAFGNVLNEYFEVGVLNLKEEIMSIDEIEGEVPPKSVIDKCMKFTLQCIEYGTGETFAVEAMKVWARANNHKWLKGYIKMIYIESRDKKDFIKEIVSKQFTL